MGTFQQRPITIVRDAMRAPAPSRLTGSAPVRHGHSESDAIAARYPSLVSRDRPIVAAKTPPGLYFAAHDPFPSLIFPDRSRARCRRFPLSVDTGPFVFFEGNL
ncbi:unnamed protein product, partial [Iphiclides podalirius]